MHQDPGSESRLRVLSYNVLGGEYRNAEPLDRILPRSNSWRPHRVQLLGTQPLDELRFLFPSDHFGVLAELRD